jgi:glucosyl-dolichyl phosphate glucuronosyltransferase
MTRHSVKSTTSSDELREDASGVAVRKSVEDISDQSKLDMFSPPAINKTVGVVIACFEMRRVEMLIRAVQSVREQDYPSHLTVVVDHNEDLYVRLLSTLPKDVTVIRNTRSRGAAGARNTAALLANRTLLAFLDDDASARPEWLRSLVRAMDQPGVVGVGGRIIPRWQEDSPRWFPPELGWAVGASIAPDGTDDFPVRNVWSGNMIVDRKAFQAVNGFRENLSKIGGAAQPEDTELCLRLSAVYGSAGQWRMVPSALVDHHVPAHRATLRYVVRRCWWEGTGKIRMRAMMDDRKRALTDEKTYLSRTIPRAVGAGVVESMRSRRPDGLLRSGTIVLGVSAAILGAATAGIGDAFARRQREISA